MYYTSKTEIETLNRKRTGTIKTNSIFNPITCDCICERKLANNNNKEKNKCSFDLKFGSVIL